MNQVVKFRDAEEGAPERVALGEQALDQLFRAARTHNGWQKRLVPRQLLQQAVELAKMGPTAANSSPLRIVFVESPEAKERLKAALDPGNVEKTLAAPVTAIMANDQAFYEHYPRLFPHADARSWFAGNDGYIAHTAMQSGTLQAAYFILALRAVGLDAGPMNGFDNATVDQAFFAGTTFRSNILINIGYGDPEKLFPRSPRLECPEIAQFA